MKAAVCREFAKPLQIEDIVLADPGPNDVLVALKACSICHSDVSYIDGIWGGDLPAVFGHEGAGIIEAVGSEVKDYAVGDRVIVTLLRHCGDCHFCQQDHEPLCEGEFHLTNNGPISSPSGEPFLQAMNSGAFAEAAVVHESQIQKVPETMPFDVASLLACGVITGWGAVMHASDLKPGQHAVVIGCGGVGLNSIQAAKVTGAASITAIDVTDEKLDVAREFGATHGVIATSKDAVDQVMEITGGRGADYVFVTVGSKVAIESAANFITKTGTVVIVGMPASDVRTQHDPGTMAAWSQRIIGTKMGNSKLSSDIPRLLEHYKKGEIKLDELISGRFNLETINDAIDQVRNGEAVKNVVLFD